MLGFRVDDAMKNGALSDSSIDRGCQIFNDKLGIMDIDGKVRNLVNDNREYFYYQLSAAQPVTDLVRCHGQAYPDCGSVTRLCNRATKPGPMTGLFGVAPHLPPAIRFASRKPTWNKSGSRNYEPQVRLSLWRTWRGKIGIPATACSRCHQAVGVAREKSGLWTVFQAHPGRPKMTFWCRTLSPASLTLDFLLSCQPSSTFAFLCLTSPVSRIPETVLSRLSLTRIIDRSFQRILEKSKQSDHMSDLL